MILRKLRIPKELLAQAPTDELHKHWGQDCYIAHSEALERLLYRRFARHGLCLKVFRELTKSERDGELSSITWGGARLSVATQAQNLFALYGIAPRVYSLAIINGKYAAQVTQYAEGEGQPNYAEARHIIKKYRIGIKGKKREDATRAAIRYTRYPFKWIGGLFVDFGRYYFRDPKWYRAYLKGKIKIRKGGTVAYEAVPELGVKGQRDHRHRVKHMQLDGLNWRGKTVLDLGCNNGAMLREALRRGAKRVVGVDFRRVSYWYQIMNWLEYWNFDMLPLDLPEQAEMVEVCTGIAQFDIVFALAIVQHMEGGYQPWLAKLTKGMLYLEGDRMPKGAKFPQGASGDAMLVGPTADEPYREALERDFRQVEWLGWIKDEDQRPLYRCWQKPRPKWGPLPKGAKARKREAVRRGQSIFGQAMMKREELAFLYDMAALAPDGLAIEIGTFNGSAAMTWATARLDRGPIVVVDNVERPILLENIRHSRYPIEVKITDSTKLVPPEMAFCFIDCDHTKSGIPYDIKIYPPQIMPGGIIVFHDFDKKEGGKGKGYVVYREVKAWHKKHGWECLGKAWRTIAFRRPLDK